MQVLEIMVEILLKLVETNIVSCGFLLLHVFMYCIVLIVVVYVYDELKTLTGFPIRIGVV